MRRNTRKTIKKDSVSEDNTELESRTLRAKTRNTIDHNKRDLAKEKN